MKAEKDCQCRISNSVLARKRISRASRQAQGAVSLSYPAATPYCDPLQTAGATSSPFKQAPLASSGILHTPISSEALRENCNQFLAGLDQLGAGTATANINLPAALQQLNLQPDPAVDQRMSRTASRDPRATTKTHSARCAFWGEAASGESSSATTFSTKRRTR